MQDYEAKLLNIKEELFAEALTGLDTPQICDVGIGTGPNIPLYAKAKVWALSHTTHCCVCACGDLQQPLMSACLVLDHAFAACMTLLQQIVAGQQHASHSRC